MFSRAAKSVVKSLGQRKYHVGENTLKTTVVKAAGGIGQNISQLLKETTRLNQLSVYDVARTSLPGTPSKISSIKSKDQILQSQNNQSPSSLSTQKLLPSGLAVVPVNNRKSESLPSVVTMNQESLMSYFTTCELETDRAIPKLDPLSSEMAAEITSEGITGNSSIRQFTNSPSLPTIGSSGLVEGLAKYKNLKNSLNATNSSMGNWKENEKLVVADSQYSEKTPRTVLMQEPGDRVRNDDYFPLGEEYEDEIGTDDHSLSRGNRSGRSQDRKMEEDYDNMIPISLSDKRGLESGREKSVLFVRTNPWTGTILDKDITEKDTWERLQTLIDKAVQSSKGLRLGEPDCGEGRPERPKRGPCHPPDGPCTPLPPPGYPCKPRPEKKPFCVKCPPKKPCNPRTCQSETEGSA